MISIFFYIVSIITVSYGVFSHNWKSRKSKLSHNNAVYSKITYGGLRGLYTIDKCIADCNGLENKKKSRFYSHAKRLENTKKIFKKYEKRKKSKFKTMLQKEVKRTNTILIVGDGIMTWGIISIIFSMIFMFLIMFSENKGKLSLAAHLFSSLILIILTIVFLIVLQTSPPLKLSMIPFLFLFGVLSSLIASFYHLLYLKSSK
jgi:hypothetical protein